MVNRTERNGFTIIEVLLVLALLAFVTLMLVPSLGNLSQSELCLTAEEVANEIRLATAAARAYGYNIRVSFNTTDQSVSLAYDIMPRTPLKEPLKLPQGIRFERTDNPYLICNSLGGFSSDPLGRGYTTILVDQRSKERFYVIAAAMSERVRTSRTSP